MLPIFDIKYSQNLDSLHFVNIGAKLGRNMLPFDCRYFQCKGNISVTVVQCSWAKIVISTKTYFGGNISNGYILGAISRSNEMNILFLV